MNIAEKVETKLWNERESSKYKYVESYIERWHDVANEDFSNYSENFHIYTKDDGTNNIDLNKTLNRMPGDILLKIAYDLDIETPGYLPAVVEKIQDYS